MENVIEKISVAVRIRPMLNHENASNMAWEPISFTSLRSIRSEKIFEFDKVYASNSTTQRIFDEMVESRIWKAMEGWNSTVLCYGQTGSGKTFTMCGKKRVPGVIPLTISTIFSYIEDTPSREFLMRCSYCEIYNECINDLLNPLNCNLPLMDDKNRGPVIVGLTEEVCKTSDQIFAILKIGDAHKQIASTNFNQKSTRSHCIERTDNENVTIGVITLFDLAGSESEKVLTEPSRNIEMILKLSEDKGKTHLPLRDSKLTRIVGPHLLGDSKIIFIANLNPTSEMQEESLNTLYIANITKSIAQTLRKNNPIGEVSYLSKFKSEMNILKEKLEGISCINSIESIGNEQETEEKASIELQLENLQNAILVSEGIRDCKMQADEEQLWDFSERRSLRLKYWRESTSTLRNSSLEEVEEEDSLPVHLNNPRISDLRMSIPEEPRVGQFSPFESKPHVEMFQYCEDQALNLGNELFQRPGVPTPHPEWLKLILDQESLITELQAQLTLKMQENSSLREEIKFCREKLLALKAKLVS